MAECNTMQTESPTTVGLARSQSQRERQARALAEAETEAAQQETTEAEAELVAVEAAEESGEQSDKKGIPQISSSQWNRRDAS